MSFFYNPFGYSPFNYPRFPEDDFFSDIPRPLTRALTRESLDTPEAFFRRSQAIMERMREEERRLMQEFFKPLEAEKSEKEDTETMEIDMTKEGPSEVQYSKKQSTIIGKDGKITKQIQRLYKDSTGRYKAETERHLGDKKQCIQWQRKSKGDELEKKNIEPTEKKEIEAFEAEWQESPLAKESSMIEN